jgi:hypothetical protein
MERERRRDWLEERGRESVGEEEKERKIKNTFLCA